MKRATTEMLNSTNMRQRPTLPPLTPEIPERKSVGVLTLPEAHAEVYNLKRILAAERRTSQRILRGMGEHLQRLEESLIQVRALYIEQVAPRPEPSERRS
jgi:hypothetical protein